MGELFCYLEKLDYLEELGVGAVWLTPLVENVDKTGVRGNQNNMPVLGDPIS